MAHSFRRGTNDLLFHYYRNLQHLSHAIDNGWIPVVDWQNYGPFPHGEDFPVNGTTNCWEYFWNQPSEYTLDEVYKSKNVILSSQNTEFYGSIPSVALTPPFSEYVDDLIACCPDGRYRRPYKEPCDNKDQSCKKNPSNCLLIFFVEIGL